MANDRISYAIQLFCTALPQARRCTKMAYPNGKSLGLVPKRP